MMQTLGATDRFGSTKANRMEIDHQKIGFSEKLFLLQERMCILQETSNAVSPYMVLKIVYYFLQNA